MLTETKDTLVTLLAAWRTNRHPRIADWIDVLSDRLAVGQPALGATGSKADIEAWKATEAARDPADFRRLGAALWGGTQHTVVWKVKALAAWDDPRLGASLLALLADPPYAGKKTLPMLNAILSALEATRDVRVAGRAQALAAQFLSVVQSSTGGYVASELAAIAERMAALPTSPPGADVVAICDGLSADDPTVERSRLLQDKAQVATNDLLDPLFSAVYSAPNDDAPRLVLADALLERADVRGEFITHQVAHAATHAWDESVDPETVRPSNVPDGKLIEWAYPLSNVGDCKYHRGFPAVIALYSRCTDRFVRHPAWSTIRAIRNAHGISQGDLEDLLRNGALGELRSVHAIGGVVFARLTDRTWPWTDVGISGLRKADPKAFRAIPNVSRLHLGLSCQKPAPEDMFASMGELTTLTVDASAPLFVHALPSAKRLQHLTLEQDNGLARGSLRGIPNLISLALAIKQVPEEGLFEGQSNTRRLSLKLGTGPKTDVVTRALLEPLVAVEELSVHHPRLSVGAGAMSLAPDALGALPALKRLTVHIGMCDDAALQRDLTLIGTGIARSRSMTSLEVMSHARNSWEQGRPPLELVTTAFDNTSLQMITIARSLHHHYGYQRGPDGAFVGSPRNP